MKRHPSFSIGVAKTVWIPRKLSKIPFRSGYESTAADLNADGYVDLISVDSMHEGQALDDDPLAGANIFWGTKNGIDFFAGIGDRRMVLTESELGSSNVADLNRDGYLDLVLGQYARQIKSNVIIYYGSKDGIDRKNRVTLKCRGRSLAIQLADYDKDGWLDIAANSYQEVGVRVFYGSPDGFDENRVVLLDVSASTDMDTADLNADGWLDLIVPSYKDFVDGYMDLGVTLIWGSPDGFKDMEFSMAAGTNCSWPYYCRFGQ